MPKKKSRKELLVEYIDDDAVSGDGAIIATAMVLMEAAEMCKNTSDTDGMIRIASAWFDIAKTLMNITEEEESKSRPFGFTGIEEIDGDDESTSGIEVRKKSW